MTALFARWVLSVSMRLTVFIIMLQKTVQACHSLSWYVITTNDRDKPMLVLPKSDPVSNIAMSEIKRGTQPLYYVAVLDLIWKWSFNGFTPS